MIDKDILKGKKCHYCNNPTIYTDNEVIYGKSYGNGKVYYCKPCDAYVGTHKGTNKSFGSVANRELRTLRSKAHKVIDPIWESKQLTRTEVYNKLSEFTGIEKKYCHVAMFNNSTCNKVIDGFNKHIGIIKHPKYNIICTSDGKAFTMEGKELKKYCGANNNGYARVGIPKRLQLEGVNRDREFLHRLICEAFHGSPIGDNKQVHHIDENKTNNKPNNLMWVNQSYNCLHRKTKGYNYTGKVYSYDVLTGKAVCYNTQAEACETIGKHAKSLYTALTKGSKCNQLHWFYEDNYKKGVERLRNG